MTRSDGSLPPSAPRPRYLQVQQVLQEMIEGTEYAPGDKIPSERELADQLGVSRMTVRKAMDNLVRMGLLERDSTAGTRVSVPKVNRLLNDPQLHSITQMVTAEGGRAGGRLLEFQITPAPNSVSQKLDIPLGSQVVMSRRLRLVNEVPFCLETSYLPAGHVPGLAAEDLAGNQSLYEVLHERYGIDAGMGDSTISVSHATAAEAAALALAEDSPILLYRTVVRDRAGVPFEYLKSVNHPQLVVFRIGEGGRR